MQHHRDDAEEDDGKFHANSFYKGAQEVAVGNMGSNLFVHF